ncbi:hypothetical protein CAPTEDRAFT_195885 [Capitella teleta]|uniref:C-type lectin domain-containing protein n=1 Tax=Capitella teleta TaxID=283909 RepID=R7TY85_CAPTE|nr:hypothetical protein CAPTEDRAFT_195885 [Capitella teleta]|eukprot:ELT98853.1 hypothetical protein CAPTEDRAFT_195885 [Capitella teleta]
MRNPERRTVGSAWAFNVLVMLRMCSLNAGETPCDDDWKFFGGSCYLVREENSIQASAQDYCEMYESNLASIHSDGEQEFIHSILNFGGEQHQAWIGLTCDSDCMMERLNWRWVDGSPMDYNEPWGLGEPDSYDPCARLRSDNKWANIACSLVFYSVCEKPGKETEESGGGSTTVATPTPSIARTTTTTIKTTVITAVTPPNMQSDAASSFLTTKNTTINKITTVVQSSSASVTTEASSGNEMDTSTATNGATNSTNEQGSTANYVIAVLSVLLIVVIVAFIYFNREKIIKTKSKEWSVHDGDQIETTTDANSTPCGQVNDNVYSGIDDTKSIHVDEDITGQERPKSGKYGKYISVDISSDGSAPKKATHVYDNADVNSDRPAQNTSDPVDASGDPVAIDNEGLYERPQNEAVSVPA